MTEVVKEDVNYDLTMHPSFPRSVNECKLASETFFACFTEHGTKLHPSDADAGYRALNRCFNQKIIYDECMKKYDKKQRPFFRVQEEYRQPKAL